MDAQQTPPKPGQAARAQAKLDAELTAIADDAMYPLASLSVLAVRGGKVVYQRQFGHRFIDEKNPARTRPVPGTGFEIVQACARLSH